MYEASKINPKYKMHHLEKFECWDCDGEFIVSKYQRNEVDLISCPYCKSGNVESMAAMVDYDQLSELGCMGIGHTESEG